MQQVLEHSRRQPAAVPTLAPPAPSANGTRQSRPRQATQRPDKNRPFTVLMVRRKRTDSHGNEIQDVFVKRESYAVYESNGRVMIQFSDDPSEASEQIRRIADLLPIRDKLRFLAKKCSDRQSYKVQIAGAIQLGLERQTAAAKHVLEVALDDCLALQASLGRLWYLTFALPFAVVIAAILFYLGTAKEVPVIQARIDESFALMLLASGGGALGALLSVAQAIRGRTVETDGYRIANILDGGLRILVGIMSGGILYLFLSSGILAYSLSTAPENSNSANEIGWHGIVLAGIAAGFLERLVPDLLARRYPIEQRQPGKLIRPAHIARRQSPPRG